MTMTLILLFLACLVFSTNSASARLTFNQTMSPSLSSTLNATYSMTPTATINPIPASPPLPESFAPVGSLWGGSIDDRFGYTVSLSDKGYLLAVGSPQYDEGGLSRVGIIQVFQRDEANHRWEEIFRITGEEEEDKVGYYSLSLSGDGKWMVFGSFYASNNAGYAKIVEVESKKVTKLVGNKGDWYGRRVPISKSGNRVAVAAKYYIRVYRMEDGSLEQIGDDISTYWARVALSAGGDVLGIGEPFYDNGKGRVRIMRWDGSRWSQIGGKILGDNDNDKFGASLDLSANGQRVLIGTWWGNYVKSYDYDGSSWKMIGKKLEGGSDDNNKFGWLVSLSNDGNRLLVGSPDFTSDGHQKLGRALVYQYYDGSWIQIGHDIIGEKARDNAGWSVSIAGDGNHFALGIPQADSEDKTNVGRVQVYKIDDAYSMSPTPTASPSPTFPPSPNSFVLWGSAGFDMFGWSVSLSDKGNMLAVASPYRNESGLSEDGLIQVFHRQEANHQWEESFHITGNKEGERIGDNSLSLSGNGKRMVFGSSRASYGRGYTKVVEIKNNKVTKLAGEWGDRFGYKVSMSSSGNRVAVGAKNYIRVFDILDDGSLKQIGDDISAVWPSIALSAGGDILGIGEDSSYNEKGRVRMMKWDSSRWSQIGKDIIGNNNDWFGYSLDLSADGQRVLIGTWGNYASVYHYNKTSWENIGKKLEGGLDEEEKFGRSVSLSNDGNKIVLGSVYFSSDGLSRRGRALVYQYHNRYWKKIGDDVIGEKANDWAGYSVSISGDGKYFALGIPKADSEDEKDVGSVMICDIE